MVTTTDPARELAELCTTLRDGADDAYGDAVLARHFGVPPWSPEFFEILFVVSDRVRWLIAAVKEFDEAQDIKNEWLSSLHAVSIAIGQDGIRNNWRHIKQNHLSEHNIKIIRFISVMARHHYVVPKLSDEEVNFLQEEIVRIIDWLKTHQLEKQDFFRQAIIDGLERFHFRLSKLRWVGWGYVLQSLRDTMHAYLALHGVAPNLATRPITEALLRKVTGFVAAVWAVAYGAKEFDETADFVLEAVEKIGQIEQGKAIISGLLGSGG